MSNELKVISDEELIPVMRDSLYPGAKEDSIKMVIAYCRASGLDPMLKPAHIVPMSVKNAQTGGYEWRDVVMPGIGLYRIQADRAGNYAGMSEPEFGPMVTENFTSKGGQSVSMTFPEWCKITASKLMPNGYVATYTAKEYWVENYATDSSKSSAPNAMWRKRPRGQIAKCAEAQALRKAWPEVGSQVTAEEMEGKTVEREVQGEVLPREPDPLPEYSDEDFTINSEKWEQLFISGKLTAKALIDKISSIATLTEQQKANLYDLEEAVKPTE